MLPRQGLCKRGNTMTNSNDNKKAYSHPQNNT